MDRERERESKIKRARIRRDIEKFLRLQTGGDLTFFMPLVETRYDRLTTKPNLGRSKFFYTWSCLDWKVEMRFDKKRYTVRCVKWERLICCHTTKIIRGLCLTMYFSLWYLSMYFPEIKQTKLYSSKYWQKLLFKQITQKPTWKSSDNKLLVHITRKKKSVNLFEKEQRVLFILFWTIHQTRPPFLFFIKLNHCYNKKVNCCSTRDFTFFTHSSINLLQYGTFSLADMNNQQSGQSLK